jgi:uncharacterized protein (DUF433 family)
MEPMGTTGLQDAIYRDPAILGGTPVFTGTRVPARTLLDYLVAGQPLAEFLDDFPSVANTPAIAILEALTSPQEALLVRLYDLGEISSGQAARLLDMPRVEFSDLLGRCNVSVFDDTMDVAAESRLGRE